MTNGKKVISASMTRAEGKRAAVLGNISDDSDKEEKKSKSEDDRPDKKKSLVRKFSLAQGVRDLRKSLRKAHSNTTESPKPFKPRTQEALTKSNGISPQRKRSDGSRTEEVESALANYDQRSNSSSMVSDTEAEEILGMILQDCITKMKDVVKEGRSFGKVLKDRENDLVKAMELTKLKVKELTNEIPHLPISDQGREQAVLDNLKNTLMQAKEVLKEARLSSNSGGVFMNALLDRAEEAERKEKEAREKALVLEEEVARLSSSSYSNSHFSDRKDSTGGDDELDVLAEKAHMEARVRELLKQLAEAKEVGRTARRQLEEKDVELREKDRRVKELEEGANGKREKAKSIEPTVPRGEVVSQQEYSELQRKYESAKQEAAEWKLKYELTTQKKKSTVDADDEEFRRRQEEKKREREEARRKRDEEIRKEEEEMERKAEQRRLRLQSLQTT